MPSSQPLPSDVAIVEVAPRDGLQNENRLVPTAAKIEFIEGLADAGHRQIEITSFVRPDLVPQLGDADELCRTLRKRKDVIYTALVPNAKGLERAVKAGLRSVAFLTAASEIFNQKNIGMSIADSLEIIRGLTVAAQKEGLRLRAYISTAFVCPHTGPVDARRTVEITNELRGMGIANVSLGDTIGAAEPDTLRRLLDTLASDGTAAEGRATALDAIALHLHDTRGRALENARVGLEEYGVREYDTSAGGLGGCPFAPGAPGNLDTEALVGLLDGMGIATGINLEAQREATRRLRDALEEADEL